MITNILLGLILGIVITSFIILNNKLLKITNILATITEILNNESTTITTTLELFKKLVERFSERVLTDNEHFKIIKDLIEKNKVEIYNNQQLLYNLPVKLETFIAEENNSIHKEIKKLAKISSKINSKRKQSNNTQK